MVDFNILYNFAEPSGWNVCNVIDSGLPVASAFPFQGRPHRLFVELDTSSNQAKLRLMRVYLWQGCRDSLVTEKVKHFRSFNCIPESFTNSAVTS